LYTHDWFWYLEDASEAPYYVMRLHRAAQFLEGKKPSKANVFRQLLEHIKDVRIVAKKRAAASTKPGSSNQEIQWLSAPINAENEAECIQWMDDNAEQSMGLICALASRGFSVSLKPGRDDDYMGTIYGQLVRDNSNTPIGISAFSPDPGDAILGVLCKFIYLLDWGKNAELGMEKNKTRFR